MLATKLELTPEVIEALNEEFEYQSLMSGTARADINDHGVAGQILTLEEYTQRARAAWVSSNREDAALDNLRKCAAIACRALILYGCPRRSGS